MGFDQYHEPPEELPAATRTFARLCASLTEEAEAIGWYEQRIAIETDPEALCRDARRHRRGVQALQHGPRVPAAAHAGVARDRPGRSCSRPATSSSTARRPRRRRPRANGDGGGYSDDGSGSLGHRQHEGSNSMSNHLLRSHAPISDSNWKLLDDEARERLGPALAARKLVDFSGPHGWDYSATNLGRITAIDDPPCDGVTGVQRHVLPARRGPGRVRDFPRRAARRRPRRCRRRPRAAGPTPPIRWRWPRTRPSSTAGARPGSPGSPRRRRTRA